MKYSRSGREKIIKEEACSPLDNYIIKHTGLAEWGRLAFRGLIYINSVGRFCFCVAIKMSHCSDRRVSFRLSKKILPPLQLITVSSLISGVHGGRSTLGQSR